MQNALISPDIGTMLTVVHQTNRPAVAQFRDQFSQMAVAVIEEIPQLLQAFAVSVQVYAAM